MFGNGEINEQAYDALAAQAERIFAQRQERLRIFDPDLFGEPGWDILLCAYIASRKGAACLVDQVAAVLGIAPSTARRWVRILEDRGILMANGEAFAISLETECKLSEMFQNQINDCSSARRSWSEP